MLIKFFRSELLIGKALCCWYWLPRLYKEKQPYGYDIHFCWLGGCIVWSRVNKTHKDIRRVPKGRPLDSGSNNLRFPTHRTRSIRDGQANASDGHWRTYGHN